MDVTREYRKKIYISSAHYLLFLERFKPKESGSARSNASARGRKESSDDERSVSSVCVVPISIVFPSALYRINFGCHKLNLQGKWKGRGRGKKITDVISSHNVTRAKRE